MTHMTYEEKLRTHYEVAYDYLLKHPEFDGRPRPGHPGLLRRGVDPSRIKPWPGVTDVRHQTREEWVEARLDAVRHGDEEPVLRSPSNGGDRR
jgi:hypothetical protein